MSGLRFAYSETHEDDLLKQRDVDFIFSPFNSKEPVGTLKLVFKFLGSFPPAVTSKILHVLSFMLFFQKINLEQPQTQAKKKEDITVVPQSSKTHFTNKHY